MSGYPDLEARIADKQVSNLDGAVSTLREALPSRIPSGMAG